MTNDETRRRYEQAKEQGRSARRNGRKRDANPYKGASLRDQATAWEAGFTEVDMERKRR